MEYEVGAAPGKVTDLAGLDAVDRPPAELAVILLHEEGGELLLEAEADAFLEVLVG